MSLYEDLSRLMAGDLSAEDAQVLRGRIDTEPNVAAAWAAMVDVGERFADLDDPAPPPELDAQVLGQHLTLRRRRRWPMWVAPVAMAATALLWLLLKTPGVDRVALVQGEHVVQGRVQVVAGDVHIDVDGLARITMEPSDDVVRASEADDQEDPMKSAFAALGGAFGGAVVTVAVLQGTAMVQVADGAPMALEAGQTESLHNSEGRRRRVIAPSTPSPGETPAQALQRLEAENHALRTALQTADFEGAMVRGQLLSHEGERSEWPGDLDPAFAPEAIQAMLDGVLTDYPELELVDLDCSEYPCVARLDTKMTDELDGRMKEFSKAVSGSVGDDAGMWMGIAQFDHGEGEEAGGAAISLAVAPEGDLEDDAVRTRTDFRGRTMLENAEQDLTDGAQRDGAQHDEEVQLP